MWHRCVLRQWDGRLAPTAHSWSFSFVPVACWSTQMRRTGNLEMKLSVSGWRLRRNDNWSLLALFVHLSAWNVLSVCVGNWARLMNATRNETSVSSLSYLPNQKERGPQTRMISLGCYLYNHEDECGSRTELHLIQIRKQLNMMSQLNKFHYDSSRTSNKSSQVVSRCSIKDRQKWCGSIYWDIKCTHLCSTPSLIK